MNKLLHHMIEYQAQIVPEKIAIMTHDTSINYADLNAKANQLANFFISSGICVGEYIALESYKTIPMLISLWACFKIGAVAVPIDPEIPLIRIKAILIKCPIKAIVCYSLIDSNIANGHADVSNLKAIVEISSKYIDLKKQNLISWNDLNNYKSFDFEIKNINDDSIAYVLYTSGSTGEPKGVALSHRAGKAFVEWSVNHFDISQSARLATTAPLHFDLSVFDVMAPSLCGATCVLIPKENLFFPKSTINYLEEMNVTHWYTVPHFLKLMDQYGDFQQGQLPTLQHLLFAGEVMPITPLQTLMNKLPHTSFHNLFGPTETNVCCSYSLPKTFQDRNIPIGVAASNALLYVIDQNNRLIEEENVEGELAVLGPSLMSFYVGNEQFTKTKLQTIYKTNGDAIDNVYLTGDRVVKCDNLYWFRGRKDNQIKRRGYRIELNEINYILTQINGVRDCITYSRLNENFDQVIICCVVNTPSITSSENEIYTALKKLLPTYMLPDKIYFTDNIPITSTHKADVAALHKMITNYS